MLYGVATAVSYIPFRHMREAVDYQLAFFCSTFLASFVLYACCHFLWRRSTPLASALFLSVGFSYILGFLCTLVSALIALHLVEPRTPVSWTMVAAQAFDERLRSSLTAADLAHERRRARAHFIEAVRAPNDPRADGPQRGECLRCDPT